MSRWVNLDDGVYVRRYRELDLSVGLVVGQSGALVIDTRGDVDQGAELAAAIREITALPWQIVLTHAHFDHCFGTAAFLPAPVWAHDGCGPALAATATRQRNEWAAYYDATSPEIADALRRTEPILPDHTVRTHVELDLGGRTAHLRYLGRGHTDHDLVVQVDGVVFAGDLVEHGAPPDFGDARPTDWPSTVDALLALTPNTVVPGHGDPVEAGFVRAQRDELALVAELRAAVGAGHLDRQQAVARSPYPADTTLTALSRP